MTTQAMPLPQVELLYEGSVKSVYQDKNDPRIAYFAFSDDYSVFDWGKMPNPIANKGKALAHMGSYLLSQLALPETWQALDNHLADQNTDLLAELRSSLTWQTLLQGGLKTHFRSLISISSPDAPWFEVDRVLIPEVQVTRVERMLVYTYESPDHQALLPRFIPLEVVFRFGMPAGSSLKKRLEADSTYAQALGLPEPPQQDVLFSRPVLEFFTKLEPTDRFLPLQEAVLVSGLGAEQFKTLYETTLALSLWLRHRFEQFDLTLWDGKFEFAWTPEGQLMLVDSIGPDELRLTYNGISLSKERIRQFYRGSAWEIALEKAKILARQTGQQDWKALCELQPPPFSAEQQAIVDSLYGTLTNTIVGEVIIPESMSLIQLTNRLTSLLSGDNAHV